MAVRTGKIMWIAPGFSLYLTCDVLTEVVSAVTATNEGDKAVDVIYTVNGREKRQTIKPGEIDVAVLPNGLAPQLGENVLIAGIE